MSTLPITIPDFVWLITSSLATVVATGATFWARSTHNKLVQTSDKVLILETKLEFIMDELKNNSRQLEEILKRI